MGVMAAFGSRPIYIWNELKTQAAGYTCEEFLINWIIWGIRPTLNPDQLKSEDPP